MRELNLDLKWARALSPMEEIMYDCHNKGYMIIRYAIRLCSKLPLQEDQVRSAVIHLRRKVPTLRLCIRKREDGNLWFFESDEEVVDFQIGGVSQYNKEHKEILNRQFNTSEGPLWRVRLFPCLPDEPFQMEHLRQEFPIQYNLLFGIHHSITDGATNIQTCSLLLNILNDIISGRKIDDEAQLGFHATPDETSEILEKVESDLLKDDTELQSMREFFDDVEAIDIHFLKACPSESPETPSTETIYYDLNADETEKFIKKCKSEGVTMNTALCTAINAAIVDILKKSGVENDVHTISHQQLVNLRRYWRIKEGNPIGNAICNTTMVSKVPKNILDNFWELAREFNKEFLDLLNSKWPFKEIVIKDMGGSKELRKFISEDLNEFLNYSYTTSNCGNLNKIFSGEGEHVQGTHLSRCTSVRKLVSVHESHTFRGRLLYALDYGPEYISREGAKLWCNTIFEILRKVM